MDCGFSGFKCRSLKNRRLRYTLPYNPRMALVAFLRGVNAGGHQTLRPSILAKKLIDSIVVNSDALISAQLGHC